MVRSIAQKGLADGLSVVVGGWDGEEEDGCES